MKYKVWLGVGLPVSVTKNLLQDHGGKVGEVCVYSATEVWLLRGNQLLSVFLCKILEKHHQVKYNGACPLYSSVLS